MSITKPYTFLPNTKARANEVNANFDTLYSQANTNISNIEANARDIDELNDTKAELNGDSTQRFAVADPVNDTDAINKQTMLGQLSPTINYIGGLTISKDSKSPNNTIIVSSGSCYDSTKKVVLSLANSTSKKNTTQAASATYYVHIVGNATGSSTNIIISNDSISPTLPSGYTLYRLIGFYTTNGNGDIKTINSNSNSISRTDMRNSATGSFPNYSAAYIIGLPYTVSEVGWVQGGVRGAYGSHTLYVNGIPFCAVEGATDNRYTDQSYGIIAVSPGDVITQNSGALECRFIPTKS